MESLPVHQNANLPVNHVAVVSNMHPMASELMRAKYEGTKVSGLVAEDMIPAVRSAIQDCFKSLGHTKMVMDEEMIEHQTVEMCRYFTSTYKNVTIQEFRIILKNMINGDYKSNEAEIITCTVQSMCHAIKSYLGGSLYKMAFTDYHAKLKLDIAPKKVLTTDEEEEIVRKGCIDVYRQFLVDGSMPVYGAPYYKYLKPRLKIEWDTETSEQIRTIAKGSSQANGTNYQTECKNAALKIWLTKMKKGFNYDQFKALIETLKK